MNPTETVVSAPASVLATFSTADIIVIICYLLLMVAIGFITGKGQKSTKDYFLGSRNVSWWLIGMSIIATETSALTFIAIPSFAFGALSFGEGNKINIATGAIDYLQLILGYVIARVIVAIFIVPNYFKGEIYSPYQILESKCGKTPRYITSILYLIGGALGAGVRIYVTAIPVMMIFKIYFPWWTINYSILVFTIIAILYTHSGGVKAVIWTDIVQFFIFMVGGILSIILITKAAGGWDSVINIGRETGRLTWIRSGLVSNSDYVAKLANPADASFWGFLWANTKEIFGGKFNIWMSLIGATIGVMYSHGVCQLNVQRILNCKNVNEGRKALIFSSVLIFPIFWLFCMIGVALYAFYSLHNFNFDMSLIIHPVQKVPKADYIFPMYIMTQMPSIVKGIIVVAILSVSMSSLSSAISALSSVLIMDLFKTFDKKVRTDKEYLRLSKYGVIVVSIFLVLVAYLAQATPLVFTLAFELAGLTSGALLGSILFVLWKKRCYPGPVIAGIIASVIVATIVLLLSKLSPVKITWPWYTPIGAVVAYGVSYLAAIGVPMPEKDFDTHESIALEKLNKENKK